MQITNESKSVTRSHVFDEGNFKIEANSVMFEILSSRIYTDVPYAIVRELSTNAADAHVEAGTQDKPFDIHLPTTWESHFSIRDYGTGLSREDISTVYTVFGSSTRRMSNDFTGCLGLGSKTPFAYADQFTISSYQNGKKLVFSAFKNEENLPAITFMGESDTDEPNGLEIHLNIKPDDIYKFQNAAKKVFQHFPVRPNVTGPDLELYEMSPIMEGEGWKLYEQAGYLPARISVLMGKICYAADGPEIKHELGRDVYLFLDVGIGDCSIAASREELQYNDHTNDNLQRLIDEATAAIRSDIDDQIKDADCKLTQAIARLKFRHIIQLPHDAISFKLNANEGDKSDGKVLYSAWGLEARRNGTQLSIDRSVEYIRPRDSYRSKGYAFIENDLGEDEKLRAMHKRRLRSWVYSQDAHTFLVSIVDRAAYVEVFGEPTIKLSELPDVPRETMTTASGDRVTPNFIKRLRPTDQRRMNDQWAPLNGEIDSDTSVCVPRKGNRIVWSGHEREPNFVRGIVRIMGIENVYGLTSSRFDKLAKSTGLENLENKARVWIQEYVDQASPEVLEMLNNKSTYGYRTTSIGDGIGSSVMNAITSGMSDTIDAVFACRERVAPTSAHRGLIEQFDIQIPRSGIDSIETISQRFYTRYPLLEHISSYSVDKSMIIEYIEMIEAKYAS